MRVYLVGNAVGAPRVGEVIVMQDVMRSMLRETRQTARAFQAVRG